MDDLDINGVLGQKRVLPCSRSRLETIWTGTTERYTPAVEWNIAPTLRRRRGLS